MYHRIGIAFDTMFMKCRLYKAALLAMEISIACKQAIAKKKTQISQVVLSEVAGLLNQHVAHMFSAQEHHDLLLAKLYCRHTTIRSLDLAHTTQGTPS